METQMEKLLLNLSNHVFNFSIKVVLAIVVFLIGVQVIKLIRRILKKSLQRANVETGVMQFLDSLIKAGLYIVLILLIAGNFGLEATSVLALLGSAGVAIGLALQGSLANFAGGVLILLLKPFKVGDYIIEDTNKNEGVVKEIQLFYTILTTPDNRVIVLPNGTLANSSLTNVTGCSTRRIDIRVGIAYDSDIRQAKKVLNEVLEKDVDSLKDQQLLVFVDLLGDSSIEIVARCWVKSENYWDAKWRITEEIKYALDEAGIQIPFPQMDVHMK